MGLPQKHRVVHRSCQPLKHTTPTRFEHRAVSHYRSPEASPAYVEQCVSWPALSMEASKNTHQPKLTRCKYSATQKTSGQPTCWITGFTATTSYRDRLSDQDRLFPAATNFSDLRFLSHTTHPTTKKKTHTAISQPFTCLLMGPGL